MTSRQLQYFPGVFDAQDLEAAKSIILTNEGAGADTATRWAQETPYVAALIAEHLQPKPGMLLLDYGCGIGRLARPLIEQFDCYVMGVDISASMREQSLSYVKDERFSVVSPAHLDALIANGLRVDAVFAVWVLQHCLDPGEDIERMRRSLWPEGRAFVLNMLKRAMPALEAKDSVAKFHWVADDKDVFGLLGERFIVEADGQVESGAVPNMADAGSRWVRLMPKPDGGPT